MKSICKASTVLCILAAGHAGMDDWERLTPGLENHDGEKMGTPVWSHDDGVCTGESYK